MQCNSMLGLYARLTGEDLCHLPSIYMHFPRSSSRCSVMQGIYAQSQGGHRYMCIVLCR